MAATNATTDARTEHTITDEFREAFDAAGGYDLVDREDIPYCLVSDDNTTTLVNTDEVEKFGITELADYEDTDATLRSGTCEYPDDKEDVPVYALKVGDDRAVYDGGRIDAISEFLELEPEHFDVSTWSRAPSDVYLLRVSVTGTPWALILAPRMVGEDGTLTLDD